MHTDNPPRRLRPRRAPFPVPVGYVQGQLTVLAWERAYHPRTGVALGWLPRVRCTCGTEKVIPRTSLLRSKVTKCIDCARASPKVGPKSWSKLEAKYPVGYQIGRLELVGWEWGRTASGVARRLPVMKCECGYQGTVSLSRLRQGILNACRQCARKVATRKIQSRHSYGSVPVELPRKDRRRLQSRINGSIQRCHNPTVKSYPNYGGRGIYVHKAWREDRGAYLAYLLTLPNWDDPALDLDRIDNNRGYEPGNLRFATKTQNTRNRRTVAALEAELAALRRELRRQKEGASYGG